MSRLVRILSDGSVEGDLDAAVGALLGARRTVALTGAGISVESGIPDFRSPGGIWSAFDPMEYATLSCFLASPDKAWRLYRALGASLAGARPNPAHRALAELEASGLVAGVVTQNIDGLHQAAGSRVVLEIHGEARRLECPSCRRLTPLLPSHLDPGPVPLCPACGSPMKPNIVLFEEAVRELPAIGRLLRGCDLLLVVGTSAEVAPASLFPGEILARGGSLLEMNLEPTRLTRSGLGPGGVFVRGKAGATLPRLAGSAIRAIRGRSGP